MESAEYRSSLIELIYQLADDDFILSYRGSEWLGLAPHIEEDVAFSSISQDLMGHAALYFSLLEELGEGDADKLTHDRSPENFHNAVLLELPNGPGSYLEEPNYDWAFTVVRNYFYTLAKKVRLNSIKENSYETLQQIVQKISIEMSYHLMHWETWFDQLINSTPEAKRKMTEAVDVVLMEMKGVFSYGLDGEKMVRLSLIESEETLIQRWRAILSEKVDFPLEIGMSSLEGRNGNHTDHLERALSTLSEVYQSVPSAEW
ncbi:1,2-phenylacetyl-CoA epoxidase subunit PaaC [Alkalihalobacillus sp. R86527]|uniref:1,2-phenylacetyl-CoA epoxidase subunit PaaC n=1 Tax=Alkalihalobacillus sp. R86527 TaxID=3093863 RepID=UPI00366D9FDC